MPVLHDWNGRKFNSATINQTTTAAECFGAMNAAGLINAELTAISLFS